MNSFIQHLDLQQQGIWFPLITGAIALLFVLLMPKRQMNWRGIYITFGVISYVTLMLDVFIVGEYFDLFDIGDPALEGIGDLITYAIIPSCLAITYLNYFNEKNKWLYVTLFTIISFLFEWELTRAGYMKLKGWQNWYSIPVYIIVYGWWLPWHFKFINHIYGGNTEES
ncbi:MAG TPA: hypothetical protein DER60_07400 [Syntrophomonas sp.]|jgi:hypothetical protein|nr:hypothetical protein [Syntrophomonas sp.]